MIEQLKAWMASKVYFDVYVQIYRNRLHVTRLDNASEMEHTALPEMPFSSSRMVWADFLAGERALRTAFQAQQRRFFQTTGTIVLHPLELTEGGLAKTEIRALVDSAEQAGARKTLILQEPSPLSLEQVRARLHEAKSCDESHFSP